MSKNLKLDYAALISPYPFYLSHVGGIKSPTLREIWDPAVTYPTYQMYLSLLLLTPQIYFEQLEASGFEEPIPSTEGIHMLDLIAQDELLQQSYLAMFNFFFVEQVHWDKANKRFVVTKDNAECGLIHPDIFEPLCDVILQRCGITRTEVDTDASKVKNKRALEILKKLQKGRQNASRHAKHDKDLELPNLITAVAVKSHSINFTNIWDLTVYQLYEQFKREQTNDYFDIQKMAVAAYGNEKNIFKGNEWYKTEN